MSNLNPLQRFLHDAAQHQMTIARDDGVYRHVIFSQPGSIECRFDLITWPGYLCYTGDMGTYVFTRVHDMFNFFRKSRPDARIDYHYWAEKVESEDRDRVRKFSHAVFRREIRAYVRRYVAGVFNKVREDDIEKKRTAVAAMKELRAAVASDVLTADDNEVRAFDAANDFTFHANACHDADSWQQLFGDEKQFEFIDFWERDCKVYTLRFLWCCHALVWGIAQYDAARRAQQQAQNTAQAVPA